jgi:nucleotide-binding universal stress UspA family protein
MINILVPTDFSDLSKIAINYAVKMATHVDGSVTLLHVMENVVVPSRSELSNRIKSVVREVEMKALADMEAIVKNATKINKPKNPIVYKIIKGDSFSDTVKSFAKKNKADLIVMGTRGASGVTKIVLGSNTVSVLEGSPVPVLVVPGDAEFKSFKNVAYASDLKHFEREVKGMMSYLKMFDSTLHVFHVAERGKDIENLKEVIKKVLKKVDYRKSTISIEKGKKVDDAIEAFVDSFKADLVIMFTHKQNFYEKLFKRSMTKEMAFQSKVPLLAFRAK